MKRIFVLAIVGLLGGCANFATGRYTVSTDNVVALRSLSGTQIAVGEFTDPENRRELACQYHGPMVTLDGETFASFIGKAFADELKMAGLYSATAPVTITGRLDQIDNSTAFGTDWELTLTVFASTGRSGTITEKYDYKGSVFSFDPGAECEQVALAFVPAVQNLIGKIIQQLPLLLEPVVTSGGSSGGKGRVAAQSSSQVEPQATNAGSPSSSVDAMCDLPSPVDAAECRGELSLGMTTNEVMKKLGRPEEMSSDGTMLRYGDRYLSFDEKSRLVGVTDRPPAGR